MTKEAPRPVVTDLSTQFEPMPKECAEMTRNKPCEGSADVELPHSPLGRVKRLKRRTDVCPLLQLVRSRADAMRLIGGRVAQSLKRAKAEGTMPHRAARLDEGSERPFVKEQEEAPVCRNRHETMGRAANRHTPQRPRSASRVAAPHTIKGVALVPCARLAYLAQSLGVQSVV